MSAYIRDAADDYVALVNLQIALAEIEAKGATIQ